MLKSVQLFGPAPILKTGVFGGQEPAFGFVSIAALALEVLKPPVGVCGLAPCCASAAI